MKYLLNAPFILDLTATLCLFLLCFLVVVGTKSIIVQVKQLFPKRDQAQIQQPVAEPKKSQPTKKRHYRRKQSPKIVPVRSIEINPEEIDRIYVKKIS